jgi:hypothetical protein
MTIEQCLPFGRRINVRTIRGRINVRTITVITCLLVIGGQSSLTRAVADEPQGKDATANKLVGTWKLVSGKYGGQRSLLPEVGTTIKHMTPTHYTWVTYGRDGEVTRIGGGLYAFNGKVLESTLEYGMGSDIKSRKGKRHTYECKVEAKKLYQSGALSTGLTLEEVWELVEK